MGATRTGVLVMLPLLVGIREGIEVSPPGRAKAESVGTGWAVALRHLPVGPLEFAPDEWLTKSGVLASDISRSSAREDQTEISVLCAKQGRKRRYFEAGGTLKLRQGDSCNTPYP